MAPLLPSETVSDNQPPGCIYGYVSYTAPQSVFTGARKRMPRSSKGFRASVPDRRSALKDLEACGFKILASSRLGACVMGPAAAWEALSGGRIEMRECLVRTTGQQTRYVTHVDIVGSRQPAAIGVARPKSKKIKLDGIVLERPRNAHSIFPSPLAPFSPKHHLRLPNDLAVALGACRAHQDGIRGAGVRVAMPDTGVFRHNFFTANSYRLNTPLNVGPGADPGADPFGHGTGGAANVFAIAPQCELQPVRCSNDDGDLIATFAGFLKAKELQGTSRPHIVTNSWGGDLGPPPVAATPDQAQQAMILEIRDALEAGLLVIFASGNGEYPFEPQVKGVLSVGGVHMTREMTLCASDAASGFASQWFAGVQVPTVCGLVGMAKRGQYLMLPVQPACRLDFTESMQLGGEAGDGTDSGDGWALFSGTSMAAPQVAGAAALVFSAKPGLTAAQVIEALRETATDVTAGRCHPNFDHPAGPGEDLATGAGLVNASAAVEYALQNF